MRRTMIAAAEWAPNTQIDRGNIPGVIAFSLNGTDMIPPPPATAVLTHLARLGNAAQIAQGKRLFHTFCINCHGVTAVSGGVLPHLCYPAALREDSVFRNILHDGVLETRGRVAFGSVSPSRSIELNRAFVTHSVNERVAELKGSDAAGAGGAK